MVARDYAIACRRWFEYWNSLAIVLIVVAMLAIQTLSVLVAASTQLSMLRLIVGTIMANSPSNLSSQACIVWFKLFLVIVGFVSAGLCIA